ncbi:MAG: ligase-associated DNA damage response exonuclease [Chitinophagaceae bacterium]|nr:ligase-associated DNA damage response exonuclease [Chitinophagaceae bacterium]
MSDLIISTPYGLYCEPADIFLDPWQSVPKAIITHAHSDHARRGCGSYLCHHHAKPLLKARLGDINVQSVEYNEKIIINGVTISLHPAGHIPGSAQIRIEYQGKVWVFSGDYKLHHDGISTNFELTPCHVFISESTFGLPFFQWPPPDQVFQEIQRWWMKNKSEGVSSILFAYSLGKAQRLLAHLQISDSPVFVHGAVHTMNEACKAAGIKLPETLRVSEVYDNRLFKGALVIAPSSANGTPWLRRFGPYRTAIVSGWMALRGARRWQAADRGFVLSDHADWNALNAVVKGTGAGKVFVTHGYTETFSRWLCENGIPAAVLHSQYTGEQTTETETAEES